MRIGFIGAGKVGFTLGKYMTVHNADVSGYYSRNGESAKEAAEFTCTKYYTELEEIIKESDALFITCPDGAIKNVWEHIKQFPLTDKCICHCSGSLSSAVFSGISQSKAYGYSIHPMFAVSDKRRSYREISKAFFTIEGNEKYLNYWRELFEGFGNSVRIITAECKASYHCAAAFAANLVCGLFDEAVRLLERCGFEENEARQAIAPMFLNNAESLAKYGAQKALTGPVERADIETVKKHLSVLSGIEADAYKSVSLMITDIAQRKNPTRDYHTLKELLEEEDGIKS